MVIQWTGPISAENAGSAEGFEGAEGASAPWGLKRLEPLARSGQTMVQDDLYSVRSDGNRVTEAFDIA